MTWISDGYVAQSKPSTSIGSGLSVGPGGGVGTVIDAMFDSA